MTHDINIEAFDTWSEQMAYVLGFIAADGCVFYRNEKPAGVTIHLHEKDTETLMQIKRFLGFSGDLYSIPAKEKTGPSKSLSFGNVTIAKKLESLGLTRHKSSELQWPNFIPAEYVSHYVRGYFDGDGSIFTSQANNPNYRRICCNIVGTKHFITGIKDTFENVYGKQVGGTFDYDTYSYLYYNGERGVLEFLYWLYDGSTPETRMSRKWERYQNFLVSEDYAKWREEQEIFTLDTVKPTYALAQDIKSDHEQLKLNANELSVKYNLNRCSVCSILAGTACLKPDDRPTSAMHYFTAWGEKKFWKDWAADSRCIVNANTLYDRVVHRGADPELAMTICPNKGLTQWVTTVGGKQTHMLSAWGETKSRYQWSKDERCVLSYSALVYRLDHMGLEPEDAISIFERYIPTTNHAPDVPSNRAMITWEIVRDIRTRHQNGEIVSIIAKDLGQTDSLVHDVVQNRSWIDEKYSPIHKKSGVITAVYKNREYTLTELSDMTGIPKTTIDRRLREGKTVEQAVRTEHFEKIRKPIEVGRTGMTTERVKAIRQDYKDGIRGMASYEKHEIKKSAYVDIVGNRVWCENIVWWKE